MSPVSWPLCQCVTSPFDMDTRYIYIYMCVFVVFMVCLCACIKMSTIDATYARVVSEIFIFIFNSPNERALRHHRLIMDGPMLIFSN